MHTALRLIDIIDMDKLQALLVPLHVATGVALGVCDADQDWLVKLGWREICMKFHRAVPQSALRCAISDDRIKAHKNRARHLAYSCAHGLVDVAFPIIVDGKHFGTFFIGQFLYEQPDEAHFRKQAEDYGYDVEAYLAALRKVAVIPQERIDQLMHVLVPLVGLIADLGHENLSRRRAEAELQAANELLEQRVEQRTHELSESLAKVKTLHGLLPICAWCKRIRDDDGYWQQVEVYVSQHSDAEFTHGMCKECCDRESEAGDGG